MTLFLGCVEKKDNSQKAPKINELVISEKRPEVPELVIKKPVDIAIPEGMAWIPGGEFSQGAVAQDKMAMPHEKPTHKVAVDGFFMDITEVTNAQF